MSHTTNDGTRTFRKLAVIGAGNMGSGIAQKMATEGFDVTLVDLDDDKVARGMHGIRATLDEGVERKIFKPDQAETVFGRIDGTADWSKLADVDLVVEAVFEDLDVKRSVFAKLDEHCRADAILGTNTSSFAVTDLARDTAHPERIVGLHYFYHPAKNRLVEVVPGRHSSPDAVRGAWALQEQLGKTPIRSADAYGFVVNRFFVPWLNEAVRLLEEELADIPTIEAACKRAFGVGMGPFELMNVTGVPIALHSARTLGEKFGPLYAPAERLAQQVDSGDPWPLGGSPDESVFDAVEARMLAVVFYVAAALVDEGVGTIEDTDIGARVGLRWPKGPFELMNRHGMARAGQLVRELADRWEIDTPSVLAEQVVRNEPFSFELVRRDDRDGVATLTINRPDAMNALNEAVVEQLFTAFERAANDDDVRGVVIAGAGKAFIAGADIRFFVKNIEADAIERIVAFTRRGHELLDAIESCRKPVVARVHGLALGGGLELALACHRIVAADRATMAFPETGIGIYPGLGGTQRTTRRVGVGLAKWLIFTGQMLPAEQAAAIGLVDACVPYDRLDAAVAEALAAGRRAADDRATPAALAATERVFGEHDADAFIAGRVDPGDDERLAKVVGRVRHKAPIALRIADRLIVDGAERPLAEGLAMELEHLPEIFGSADALEGLSSLGRRRPEFKDA